MVIVATQAGFSAELGAFIMGSILAETTKAEKVELLMKPVKNLFGAIFFVSVGMLIDPEKIIAYRWEVLAFFLLILVVKPVAVTIGSLVSGQPLQQAIRVGMSMGQIGEFAFIVATLGLTLGVISDFLFGSTGPRGGKRQGLVQSVLRAEARRGATKLLRTVLGMFSKRR